MSAFQAPSKARRVWIGLNDSGAGWGHFRGLDWKTDEYQIPTDEDIAAAIWDTARYGPVYLTIGKALDAAAGRAWVDASPDEMFEMWIHAPGIETFGEYAARRRGDHQPGD